MRRAALALAMILPLALTAPAAADHHEAARGAVETLTATELSALVEAGEVVLVDVRTPAEFADARLPGGLNMPLTHFDPSAIPMEAVRETILYCASSRRSGIAAEQLAAHTGGTVRHLEGGIQAWQAADLPTVSEDAAD